MRELNWPVIVFDFDGTIVDSAPGIIASLRAALLEVGVEPPPPEVLKRFVGPPLEEGLGALLGEGDERLRAAAVAYRASYRESGMLGATTFPGVERLLRSLVREGARLALATAKVESVAVEMVEALGLAEFFAAVCGANAELGRSNKTEIVAAACAALGLGPGAHAVVVGDRSHDVVGAARNGLACIGVAWGYAAEGELVDAGALTVANDVADLTDLLFVDED